VNWHEVIDERSYEMDQVIADVLRRDPAQLEKVVAWIERFLADPDFSIHSKDDLTEWLDLIKSRGLPGVLADDVTQSFHRQVARRMLDAGALRMYAMRMNERIVAVFYGFAHQGTTYYYLSGFDPALDRLSIGSILVAHAVEEAVREGGTTFDFLRGAEEYKYSWGATDRINQRRQLFRG